MTSSDLAASARSTSTCFVKSSKSPARKPLYGALSFLGGGAFFLSSTGAPRTVSSKIASNVAYLFPVKSC